MNIRLMRMRGKPGTYCYGESVNGRPRFLVEPKDRPKGAREWLLTDHLRHSLCVARGWSNQMRFTTLRDVRFQIASIYRRDPDPLAPLSWAPDFTIDYEIHPACRDWKGQSGRIYRDNHGWFSHPEIESPTPALSIWFFDGPMTEVRS